MSSRLIQAEVWDGYLLAAHVLLPYDLNQEPFLSFSVRMISSPLVGISLEASPVAQATPWLSGLCDVSSGQSHGLFSKTDQ